MSILAAPADVRTLLLDMNGTFMFGHDRLGVGQDFFPAYVRLGGAGLTQHALNDAVRRTVDDLGRMYHDDTRSTGFPSVSAVVSKVLGELNAAERMLVEQVIAEHELGTVSDENLSALSALSQRFRLLVVSNLWSDSARWVEYLSGLGDTLFAGFVFSSDIGVNKPAREIFEHALGLAEADPSDVIMVGDDLRRDMLPAASLGMRTAWVTENPPPSCDFDYAAPRFSDLL